MKRKRDSRKEDEIRKRQEEEKSEGIERLKELYAEWQEKRNPRKYYDVEKYLIDEMDELDSERFW